MTHIEQLKIELERLSQEAFARLRRWFAEKDWELWDQQLEADSSSGKLDFLLDEARQAKVDKTV